MIELRDMVDADLSILFEYQRDPAAVHMAAFTAKDPDDRAAYTAHWTRLLADGSILKRTIRRDGRVVGSIASFGSGDEREVTYGVAREHWGKGIATAALRDFLATERTRPLQARAASDNAASIRVLEKCGFRIVRHERGFANARGATIDEVVLRLDA